LEKKKNNEIISAGCKDTNPMWDLRMIGAREYPHFSESKSLIDSIIDAALRSLAWLNLAMWMQEMTLIQMHPHSVGYVHRIRRYSDIIGRIDFVRKSKNLYKLCGESCDAFTIFRRTVMANLLNGSGRAVPEIADVHQCCLIRFNSLQQISGNDLL
jgi:hypothetical protein